MACRHYLPVAQATKTEQEFRRMDIVLQTGARRLKKSRATRGMATK
jgi:hypothetical protein